MRGVWQVSIRRACGVLQIRRSTYHYKSRRPSQAGLRKRIREIAKARVRYGYRRIHVLLEREGWQVNHKRVYRLYIDEGLQIRSKRPKRKAAAKLREDRKPPSGPNQVWSMDFLSDQLFDGSRIRILAIVDAFSRLSPAIDVRQRYRGVDVIDTLERVTAITRQIIVFQQDSVLQRLVPAFDLALCLRVIRRATDVVHAALFQPVRKVAGDVRRSIVAEQPGLVDDFGSIAA